MIVNLGSKEDPRMVKIGKIYTEQERKEILKLLTKYKDVIHGVMKTLKPMIQI